LNKYAIVCAFLRSLCRELATKQVQAALQPNSSSSCAELQQELAELSALHEQLAEETLQQQLPLLGQVRLSTSLIG
jgi:hypothetical protein